MLTVYVKRSTLDVWQGSEYWSVQCTNILIFDDFNEMVFVMDDLNVHKGSKVVAFFWYPVVKL